MKTFSCWSPKKEACRSGRGKKEKGNGGRGEKGRGGGKKEGGEKKRINEGRGQVTQRAVGGCSSKSPLLQEKRDPAAKAIFETMVEKETWNQVGWEKVGDFRGTGR